jgi:hypothetical protein
MDECRRRVVELREDQAPEAPNQTPRRPDTPTVVMIGTENPSLTQETMEEYFDRRTVASEPGGDDDADAIWVKCFERKCRLHKLQLLPCKLQEEIWEEQALTMMWPTIGKHLIKLIQASWPDLQGDLRVRNAIDRYAESKIQKELPEPLNACFTQADARLRSSTAQRGLENLILYAAKQLQWTRLGKVTQVCVCKPRIKAESSTRTITKCFDVHGNRLPSLQSYYSRKS